MSKKNALIVFAGLCATSIAIAQAPQPFTISAEAGRPLAKALDQLQHELLAPIDYEEAPFAYAADLKSVAVVASGNSPVVAFRVTLDPAGITPFSAATTVYQSYHSAGLPGEYTITQKNGWVSVSPHGISGVGGIPQSDVPVMSHTLSFPAAPRKGRDTLQLITDGLSKSTGSSVLLLNQPFWDGDTVTVGSDGEEAGDLIHKIGATISRPVSFQCLYDAPSRTYYLNVIVVAPAPVPGTTALPPARKLPTNGPVNSPWFVKQ
jgi:hypothetical protein